MITHKALLAALLVPLGATLAVAPGASATTPHAPTAPTAVSASAAFRSPEAALDRVAQPLRTTDPTGGTADLRPFGRMVGDARVVALGEASHSSHEFFTLKHRVLRYLVEEKGFRAFHNSHIALQSYVPATYPRVQGDFLREQLGDGYLSVGLTFDHGSFNAFDHDGAPGQFTVGPAAPGTAEHTLDRVRHRDFVVDLRSAPAPARDWLAAPHTLKNIGATYPGIADVPQVGLAASHARRIGPGA
ncbi:erythromycin esterase family protein [Kitasatospora sp. NPDC051853]|uniref:erythromycin esterase family protein n=1 Tax=Kitasatospora sp. NPDC051853 TaxID=3364058 RepID=UPI00378D88B7